MNFDGLTVEEWFLKKNISDFNYNYVTNYQAIKQAVVNHLKDATRGGDNFDGISLTWHNEFHINTVIKRATKLLKYKKCKLEPYEIYYLLVSIQIHDLGNMRGRTGHEARAIEILDTVYKNIDSTEQSIINDIVEAHSGDIEGDKDKISHIEEETIHVEKIHTRFVAAILRFADELADEPNRASINLLKEGQLKKGSEIHHLYAHSLANTLLPANSKTANLNFAIVKEFAEKKY